MKLRLATIEDASAIHDVIRKSARSLCSPDYTTAQIEMALQGAFGLDTQLIQDDTYYVIEHSDSVVACGGWSYRQTLFGSDSARQRDSARIDPASGAAKIRAFFVVPDFSRRGLGRQLLSACESAATDAGYERLELMATLAGQRLYAQCGYIASKPIDYDLGDGLLISFVPMHKQMTQVASGQIKTPVGNDGCQ